MVWTGMVNVLLFCVTHKILPARPVVPGWRGLFRLSGFTESNPSQDLEKGWLEERMSPRPQLGLLDDPHGPQLRIKIDNDIDNTGKNRDGISNGNRSTVPSLQLAAPQRPLPALVREERKRVRSEISELTMVGRR